MNEEEQEEIKQVNEGQESAKSIITEVERQDINEKKQQIKNGMKNVLRKIIARLAPILIKVLLIFLVLILIIALISGFVSIINYETSYIASQTAIDIAEDVSIETEKGGLGYSGYINLSDNVINKLVTKLINNGVTPEKLKLTGEKGEGENYEYATVTDSSTGENYYVLPSSMKRFFRAYYAAELLTQYPDMSSDPGNKWGVVTDFLQQIAEESGKYQGCIKIVDENNKEKYLSYAQPDTFKRWCENNERQATEHFSLEGSSLLLAGYEEDGNGVITSMYVAPVNYRAIASKYGMPMEFLIDLNLATENPTFTLAVASLIANSQIVLTRQYNTIEVEKTEKRTWEEQEEQEVKEPVLDANNNPVYINGELLYNIRYETVTVQKESITYIHTKSYTPTVQLYFADSWYVYEEKSYNEQEAFTSLDDSFMEDDVSVEITGTMINTTYTESPNKKTESKENVFIGLMKNAEGGEYDEDDDFSKIPEYIPEGEHKVVKYHLPLTDNYDAPHQTIGTNPEHLFYLLSTNSKTQNQEQIMRYIMYKYNGKDYGVTDFDDMMASLVSMIEVGTGDFVVDTRACDQSLVITDVETLKKAFSGYGGSSELIKHAQDFLDMQNEYGVNAVFAAAVSITETSGGRAGQAINGKNAWFNITCTCGNPEHGRFEAYASVGDSIYAFGRLISGSLYFGDGRKTVGTIGDRYCPNAEVAGQANQWASNTNAYMVKMYNAAGIDISSVMGSGEAVGDVAKMVQWAEAQVGKSQYIRPDTGTTIQSNGMCAAFCSSAYAAAGFGFLGGNANNMSNLGEHHSIVRVGGKIDCTGVPVGALFIANKTPTEDGQKYGHVALYIGNGYIIEAGGKTIRKSHIDQSYYPNRYDYWALGKSLENYMMSDEYKSLSQNNTEE